MAPGRIYNSMAYTTFPPRGFLPVKIPAVPDAGKAETIYLSGNPYFRNPPGAVLIAQDHTRLFLKSYGYDHSQKKLFTLTTVK